MWTEYRPFIAFIVATALVSCTPSDPDTPATTATPPQVLGSEIERSYIEVGMYQEWHDARVAETAGPVLLPLDDATAGSPILIEVLDSPGHPITATLRDEAGNALEELKTAGSGLWNDLLFKSTDTPAKDMLLTTDGSVSVGRVDFITNASPPEPDIIVILIDTLRADHMGVYGYPRNTSPHMDAFAKDSILFTEYITQTSWTRTSVASLLTSTYPNIHGAHDRGDVVRDSVDWLSTALQGAGFDTQGIVTNPNCLPIWGFGKGFRRYADSNSQDWFSSDDADAIRLSMDFLASPSSRPRFHYLHLLAPHSPYLPKEPHKSALHRPRADGQSDTDFERQNTVDQYDAEIAYVDSELGTFFARLKEIGKYDSSLIILLSDHGEEFWEHGDVSHGKTLYNEQLKVPFIVKLPNNERAGTRYEHLVECVDVAPSILEYVGVDSPAGFQGTSFVSALNANEPYKTMAYTSLRLDQASMEATQTTGEKLIFDLARQDKQWFNLETDPGEQNPQNTSPLDPDPLMRHIQTMSRDGAQGLHILLTHDSKSDIRFSGTLSGIREYTLNYPDELSEAALSDGTLSFSIDMPKADNPYLPSAKWRKSLADPMMRKLLVIQRPEDFMTEMDYAEIVIPAEFSDNIQIDIQVNGEAVPHDQVHIGTVDNHGSVAQLSGTPAQWIAPQFAMSLESLPRATGVYVWHVPAAQAIADEDLDPDLKDALEGLGYLE